MLTTWQLSGTPKFHGERKLNEEQIVQLLDASGKVKAINRNFFGKPDTSDDYPFYQWSLRTTEHDMATDFCAKVRSGSIRLQGKKVAPGAESQSENF
jgi:hypothetical protein